MVEVKEAVSIAKNFMKDLYASSFSLKDLILEEVDQTDDGKYWLITLGFSREKPNISALLPSVQIERVYKSIKVDKETGEPVAMQIRAV